MNTGVKQIWFPIIRTAFVQAVILAVMGVVCAVAVNSLRHDPLPWKKAEDASGRAVSFPVISVEEAYKRHQQGTIRFVDAREPSDFAAGHLPGALNIPVEKAEAFLNVLKSHGFTGKDLVIYCSGPDCPLSRELAEKLAVRGLKGLILIPDGWSGWYGSGFPIEEKGSRP